MSTTQCFAVSIHVLTLLASNKDSLVTSETLAESVDTNPVVIRRTMSHLRQHGLVDSRPGTNGGWLMTKPPEQTSLWEIYHAINHDCVLSIHTHPNPECPIGGNIQASLTDVFGKAQNAMEMELRKFTIADILQDVISHAGETG
jgi:Rrf2 family protein